MTFTTPDYWTHFGATFYGTLVIPRCWTGDGLQLNYSPEPWDAGLSYCNLDDKLTYVHMDGHFGPGTWIVDDAAHTANYIGDNATAYIFGDFMCDPFEPDTTGWVFTYTYL